MKNGTFFPYMLVGLLLLSVGSNVYLVIRATSDPSFAIEPDYYSKAVRWDELQAERAASRDLGWKIQVVARRDQLRIALRDSLGRPIDGAQVEVEAFHNARANDRIREKLVPKGLGVYVLNRTFHRLGVWEYRLAALLDKQKFVHVTQEVVR